MIHLIEETFFLLHKTWNVRHSTLFIISLRKNNSRRRVFYPIRGIYRTCGNLEMSNGWECRNLFNKLCAAVDKTFNFAHLNHHSRSSTKLYWISINRFFADLFSKTQTSLRWSVATLAATSWILLCTEIAFSVFVLMIAGENREQNAPCVLHQSIKTLEFLVNTVGGGRQTENQNNSSRQLVRRYEHICYAMRMHWHSQIQYCLLGSSSSATWTKKAIVRPWSICYLIYSDRWWDDNDLRIQ